MWRFLWFFINLFECLSLRTFHLFLSFWCNQYSILKLSLFNHLINLLLSNLLFFVEIRLAFFLPSHHVTQYITESIHFVHFLEFFQTFCHNLFVVHSFLSLDFLSYLILNLEGFFLGFIVCYLFLKHLLNIEPLVSLKNSLIRHSLSRKDLKFV